MSTKFWVVDMHGTWSETDDIGGCPRPVGIISRGWGGEGYAWNVPHAYKIGGSTELGRAMAAVENAIRCAREVPHGDY